MVIVAGIARFEPNNRKLLGFTAIASQIVESIVLHLKLMNIIITFTAGAVVCFIRCISLHCTSNWSATATSLPLLPCSKNHLIPTDSNEIHTTGEKCEQRILFLSVSVVSFRRMPSVEMEIPQTFSCFIIFIYSLVFFVCKNNTANRVLSPCILRICRCTMLFSHFNCVEILILFIGVLFWLRLLFVHF